MPLERKAGAIVMTIKAIVTDIEGTTTSINFVHEVLFPYASENLPKYLQKHYARPDIAAILDDVRSDTGEAGAPEDRLVEILLEWIREDRKATPLKTLQGLIWREGYEQGDFTGHLYEEVAARLQAWSESGIDLYVYSSGSVEAQKLLFGYSDAGNLCPLFKGYFDTRIGHKKDVRSYTAIVAELKLSADEILFLSDIAAELDAASDAGLQTVQLIRQTDVVVGEHRQASSFNDIVIDARARKQESPKK